MKWLRRLLFWRKKAADAVGLPAEGSPIQVRVRGHVTADQVGFFCSRPTAYFGLSTQKAEQFAQSILERVKWVREKQRSITGGGRVRLE